MDEASGKLTVFFEEPFWVGVFERFSNGRLSVCKVTFGAEPKDCQVWDFILRHYHELTFSPAIETEVRQAADNPKRRQRRAGEQLRTSGWAQSRSRRCRCSGRQRKPGGSKAAESGRRPKNSAGLN